MPKLKNSNATFWVIFKHCANLLYLMTDLMHDVEVYQGKGTSWRLNFPILHGNWRYFWGTWTTPTYVSQWKLGQNYRPTIFWAVNPSLELPGETLCVIAHQAWQSRCSVGRYTSEESIPLPSDLRVRLSLCIPSRCNKGQVIGLLLYRLISAATAPVSFYSFWELLRVIKSYQKLFRVIDQELLRVIEGYRELLRYI